MAMDVTTAAKKVVKEFDCEKMHRMMTLLDRKWYFDSKPFSQSEPRIPSVEEIRITAYELMLEVLASYFVSKQPVRSSKFDLHAVIDQRGVRLDFFLVNGYQHIG